MPAIHICKLYVSCACVSKLANGSIIWCHVLMSFAKIPDINIICTLYMYKCMWCVTNH